MLKRLRPGPLATALERIARWAGVLANFVVYQAAAQLVAMLAGIVVVRALPKQDYAWYTIANSMIATFIILADAGVSPSVSGIGGRVWQDRAKLAQVIATALRFRAWLRNLICLPIVIALGALLYKNGAGVGALLVLVPLVLAAAGFSLDSGILVIVPRLIGDVRFLRIVELAAAAARLLILLPLALIGLSAETAILTVCIGYGLEYWLVRRSARGAIGRPREESPRVRQELYAVAAKQWPNALYYIFQGQITIWLLSIFGSSSTIADLGALNRVGVIYTALLAAVQGVVLPRYARCQEPGRLWTLYWEIWLLFLLLVASPLPVVLLAPHPILWVLGGQYMHLSWELFLATLSAATGACNGLAWMINATRLWILPPWITIPITLAAQVVCVSLIGASTVEEVLWFSIVTNLVQIATSVIVAGTSIRRARRAVSAAPAG
jgi:O-antigen/teichoic acid export membrane protein